MIGRWILCIALAGGAAATLVRATAVDLPLVQPASLVYQGSFKVPADIAPSGAAKLGFEYGGTAISYNPDHHSLFIVGHDWEQMVAEIAIPPIGGIATLIQPLTNLSEGRGVGSGTTKVGGLLSYQGRLYFNEYLYYDGGGVQTQSLFARPLDFSLQGQVDGPMRVGPLGAGFYSGYMAIVPSSLRSLLRGPVLVGNCCLPIISRTSYGPAAFAFNPVEAAIGKAIPLVYYPSTHTTLGPWERATQYFSGADTVRGIVVPDGYRSVLFFGRHGTNFCYGAAECGDPTSSAKGTHGDPYLSYVWAYDAVELGDVADGRRQPWEVRPYATWELPDLDGADLGGAAFDQSTGRVFVSRLNGDGDRPTINVYQVQSPAGRRESSPAAEPIGHAMPRP